MKKQILLKSALSLVAVAAAGSAFAAATSVLDVDFESFSDGYAITNADYWAADGADESKVAGDSSNLYLDLKTEGSTLTREIDQASTLNTALSGGTLTVDNPAVFSAEVKFVPSDSLVSGLPGGTDNTKFAIYAYENNGSTNLVVYHAANVEGETDLVYTHDVTAATVNPDEFTTVTVKMFTDENVPDTLFFTVDLGGNPVSPTVTDVDAQETTWFRAVNASTGAAFSSICFKGTGAVDDLKVDLGEDEVNSWVVRLGDPVDGAYLIDDEAELISFQQGVAAGLTTAGTTFKLTADIALTAAWPGIGLQNGKDVYNTAAFDDAAFCGIFDGQNYTISGFQMIGKGDNPEGLDYCGFFNSTYGATIRNLKIQYAGALFAADTNASTKESGATFVGVAKNSTLQNLTSLQYDASTGVSCSKGFGGIVGYLTSGTSVESCTNNVNMTSLANNKCGGIAMIAQGGSAVSISNCQNNGTQTTGSSNSEYGAIVGYVGLDITIANCETTVGRFLKHQGNTVTLQGVNKGDARVVSYHGAATPGLNFAIVDGNVATFVADNALAAGNTYKVMGPSATATFEFAAAGTIAFDTALATPTYAITAPGLDLTDTTEGTVKTYTAAAPAPAGFDGGEEGTTFSIASDKQTALEGNLPEGVASLEAIADADSNLTYAQAYALGLWDENASEVAPLNAEITFDNQGRPQVELDADNAVASYDITCKLYGSTSLPVSTSGTVLAEGAPGTALVDTTASSDTTKFYKVVIVISDKQ